jgi:hypothetical protein
VLIEEGEFEEAARKLEGVIPAPPAPVLPELAALSAAYRARLPDADVPAREREFEALGERVWPIARLEAHHSFWKATGSPDHLARAHEILQVAVENAPEEYRESTIANVPLHREITAAWAERDG